MSKVTYLIGAGASAEDLPLVRTLKDEKGNSIKEGLPDAFRRIGQQIVKEYANLSVNRNLAGDIEKDFQWLAERSEFFDTVDTFAKYCYLIDKKDLAKVKKLLSLYFSIEQGWNQKIDKRYLVFLTTILEDGVKFPNQIKILNWNYDFQFQIACKIFPSYPLILRFYPNINMDYPEAGQQINNYSLVHLNGIAGYSRNQEGSIFDNFSLKEKSFDELFKHYYDRTGKLTNLLTFAWETDKDHIFQRSIEIARDIIKNSRTLVVIGYSFPFFNRELDKGIIQTLTETKILKKIYYQDKYRSGDFLRSQFSLSKDIDIINIKEVDQLYVPFEL
ncbi:MAG: DUF2764 domain-containing protein [Bacteroidales bacterium]|nr:DUF2764 domain-containing protein [Bacteroidales bacterium]